MKSSLSQVCLSTAQAIVVLSVLSVAAPSALAQAESPSLEQLQQLLADGSCAKLVNELDALGDAVDRDPDLLTLRGNCILKNGRAVSMVFDQSRFDRIEVALGLETVPPDLRDSLTQTVTKHDDEAAEQGVELFQQALSLAPERSDLVVGNIALLQSLDRGDEALALLEKKHASIDGTGLIQLGQVIQDDLRAGAHARAMNLATTLNRLFPEYSTGPIAEALVHLKMGSTREALNAFGEAYARDTSNELATREYVRLLVFSRDYEKALPMLVERANSAPIYKYWLALVRHRQSPGSAAALWREVQAEYSRPETPNPRIARTAGVFLQQLESKSPVSPVTRLRTARRFVDSGMTLPAIIEADALIARKSSEIEARVLLADAYSRAQIFDYAADVLAEGLSTLDEGAALNSAYSPAELQLKRARALLGANRGTEAVTAYERAADLGRPQAYEHGLAALAAGDSKKAIALFEEVAGGDSARAARARAKLNQLGAESGT